MKRRFPPWALWALAARAARQLPAAARLALEDLQTADEPTLGPNPPYQNVNGIAVIPAYGMLVPEHSLWGRFFGGEVSHNELRIALAAATAASDVRRSLVIWSSPGGPTDGLSGLADDLRALGERKPWHSFTQSLMASAAYFVGCQARRIYVSPEGMVGSIGTLWNVIDDSRAAEAAGIHVEEFKSAPLKGIGGPGHALTDADRAEMQQLVDKLGAVFRGAVARGRGLSAAQVAALADGGLEVGAAAVAMRLADRVATLSEILAEDGGTANAGRSVRP